jgi:hypothetical protein
VSDAELGRHKTAHHGHRRVIAIGPKAQEVIRPFLRTDLRAFLFQPGDAVTNQRWQQRRRPNGRYSVQSYRQAVRRACLRADAAAHRAQPDIPGDQVIVPAWRPHQLRHTKATEIRREAGLDAARAVLQATGRASGFGAPNPEVGGVNPGVGGVNPGVGSRSVAPHRPVDLDRLARQLRPRLDDVYQRCYSEREIQQVLYRSIGSLPPDVLGALDKSYDLNDVPDAMRAFDAAFRREMDAAAG